MKRLAVLAVSCATVVFAMHMACKKYAYSLQADHMRQQFFAQQEELLKRLSKLLANVVKQRDVGAVSALLSAYEGALFALQIPVNLQVAIFDAPSQVIGLLAEFAPDENYYMRIMQHPEKLAYSTTYTKSAMPDYPILNYGVGIVDERGTVVGIVEAKIPEQVLHQQMQVQVHFYWYICAWFIVYASVTALLITIYAHYLRRKTLHASELQLLQNCLTVQDKYQSMQVFEANVNVLQIIADVYAVTIVTARDKQIIFNVPHMHGRGIYCYTQQKLLAQTLITIVKNILQQLDPQSELTLELHLSKDHIEFVFNDNGFYNELETHWYPISDYITHTHTAYVGNTIIYSISRLVKNNVVQIEQFQD